MEYLVTWSDGEEVRYQFMDSAVLKRARLEPDRIYSIIELATGQVITS
ncbi:hypothetical protein [Heliorestis convoluta]|uniref:Uncharacterized protein n=1 Tax=Heliorestis convoluta TaxID=356322 RepID=A0A5Q2N2X2_9FIRM|nr:hypothetical protein [Heliorestis convoluta]QGG46680.1 hypothetical protein FTV88_0501 [Heliorestis convoluta]